MSAMFRLKASDSAATFAHSTSPTNSGLKMKFPIYNGRDKVKAEYKLITAASP